MDRWVSARQRVRGDAQVLREELIHRLPELLQDAAGTEGPVQPAGDGSFTMPLLAQIAHQSVVKRVRVRIEPERSTRHWTRIPMTWEAVGASHVFPVFHGAVELEQLDDNYVELAIIGHYDPPLGPLGAAVDAIGLHGPAQATIDWLTTALAEALSRSIKHAPARPDREPHRLLVRQVMATRPLLLRVDDNLRDAARSLLIAGVEGAAVVDGNGRPVGVLSLKDLLDKVVPAPIGFGKRSRDGRRHHAATTVGEACTRPARTTEADARLRDAAAEMVRHSVGRLVVLDGAKVVGLVDRADTLTVLVRNDDVVATAARHVLRDLAPEADVEVAHGIVTVRGAVDTRSKQGLLLSKVRDLDGVLDVIGQEFTWLHDDTLVTPMIP